MVTRVPVKTGGRPKMISSFLPVVANSLTLNRVLRPVIPLSTLTSWHKGCWDLEVTAPKAA
jgi:hypothetical protein